MERKSVRVSVMLAAFVALLLIAAPHEARAATGSPDWSNCRQNNYQGGITWAQGKAQAIGQVWQNTTPPTSNNACLTKLMNLFNTIGAITDPFNLIWTLVWSAIQSIVTKLCQQVLEVVGSAINMLKSALCIPLPSMNLSFSLGGGIFGGSSSCSGISLLGSVPTSSSGAALPGVWNMWNFQPR